jgi:hypothetical protein
LVLSLLPPNLVGKIAQMEKPGLLMRNSTQTTAAQLGCT